LRGRKRHDAVALYPTAGTPPGRIPLPKLMKEGI
jgi:hypothetical protein